MRKRMIALVTPAKNEGENIPFIVESIARQKLIPNVWVFVNDLSTDNSVELLKSEFLKYDQLRKCKLYIIDNNTTMTEYGLGVKYSSVTTFGFNFIKQLEKEKNVLFDYIGILDCDVFPDSTYYEKLIEKFMNDEKLGIASGGTQYEIDTGLKNIVYHRHAAGMMRLWRRQCFDETGYYPSISQDAVSEARAKMMGWKVRSFPDITVRMRSMGKKSKYEYYGMSYYIRWVNPLSVYLHYLKLKYSGKKDNAKSFLAGYKNAKKNKVSRLNDDLAKKYFQHQLFYRLTGR